MVSDKSNEMDVVIDRILRERLEDFDVPSEVRAAIRDEFINVIARPERKPHGACVMTPEASLAADKAKERGRVQAPDSDKPQII